MPQVRWATPDQHEFLVQCLPRYLEVQKTGDFTVFWADTYEDWEREFPEGQVLFPDRAVLDDSPEEREALTSAIKTRHTQLQTWYRWRSSAPKARSLKRRDKAFGSLFSHTRLPTRSEIYSKLYYTERIRDEVQSAIRKAKATTRGEKLVLTTQVTRRLWEAEEDEEVKAKVEAMLQTLIAKKAIPLTAAPRTPEQYLQAINDCPRVLGHFLDSLAERTGWAFTVLMGGPDPSAKGEINVASYHVGETTLNKQFGQAHMSFEKTYMEPYADFLSQMYLTQICRSRALGATVEESSNDMIEANDKALPDLDGLYTILKTDDASMSATVSITVEGDASPVSTSDSMNSEPLPKPPSSVPSPLPFPAGPSISAAFSQDQPTEIDAELRLNNPVMDKVTPTGPPRWVRAEVDLWGQDYSSAVLEFKSEDDAQTLLATKQIAIFARFCKVVPHADRPPIMQCGNCWAFGHHASRCRDTAKCRVCAGPHTEHEHTPTNEETAQGEDTPPQQCFKCVNCGDNHPATDRKCADRARAIGASKESKKTSTQTGGKTRPPRKKPTTTATTTTTAPKAPATRTPNTVTGTTSRPPPLGNTTAGNTGMHGGPQDDTEDNMEEHMDTEDTGEHLDTGWGIATSRTHQGTLKKAKSHTAPPQRSPSTNKFAGLQNESDDPYASLHGTKKLNTNRSNHVCHTLLNAYIDRFDLLLITEPWWDKIGNDQIGPVAHAAWTPILPTATIPRGQRPRVIAYTKTRPDFSITLRSDIAQDLDIQVLDVQQANFPTTTIVNIYSQPRVKSSIGRRTDASVRLQTLQLPEDDPVIISGDWNQHHPDWSTNNKPPSTKTRQLVDWTREKGYTLLNEKGVPTYFEHRTRGATTVIDLTFANPAAITLDTTKEWTVDGSLSCGSDHHTIRWVIDHGSAEIENITGTKYNFKDTDPKEWKTAFEAEMEKESDRWETLTNLDIPRSPEQLDEDVAFLTEAMKTATATTAKEKRPSKKAKPWWTKALNETNAERTSLCKQQQEHIAQWGTPCEELMEARKNPKPRPGGPRPPKIPDNPTDTSLDMYIDDEHSEAPEKTELMHHSWRRDGGHSPNIKLPTGNNTDVSIATGDTIRILGVFFDRRLTFNQHVRILADRAGNAVRGSQMLANTVKGLSQVELRTLYRACIVPVLTYASPIWWSGKKTHINILDKVQNTALRHIAGAFKTTPIKALEVDLSIPPINLALDLANARYADCLHKLNTTNPIIQRLSDEWRDGEKPSTPPPLPSQKPTRSKKTPKPTQLESIATQTYRPTEGERIIPLIAPPWRKTARDFGKRLTIIEATPDVKKKEAAKAHNARIRTFNTNPAHILVYSDGSMLDDAHSQKKNVGWGIVGYHNDREVVTRRGGLGHTAEVYDAELTGLVVAAREATRHTCHNPIIKHIHIYADNTAAVTSVFEPKSAPGQYNMRSFNKIITEFLDQDPTRRQRRMVPGTHRREGKQKSGRRSQGGSATVAKPIHDWNRTPPTGGFGVANQFLPAWKIRDHVKATEREVFSRVTQCRTKHTFIELDLQDILGTNKGVETLAKFLKKSGAFTKTGNPRNAPEPPSIDDEANVDNNEVEEHWTSQSFYYILSITTFHFGIVS
ncbi:hypothetical protein D9615_005662 [Tricholomella constricta]|uniref:Endonuclease/exonuclease/phosphatase domain-containing protein n=1 Tax=Tricholomella constricta TaxID=117010 RepID=A0A8H5M3X1_9AGAR|nr:hypothetical protein D9615_005662 [Tricholomella constricta]